MQFNLIRYSYYLSKVRSDKKITMSLVGQPVYINGKQGRYLGVCRFHGATAFKDGVWCGVELDRPIGKNDVRFLR